MPPCACTMIAQFNQSCETNERARHLKDAAHAHAATERREKWRSDNLIAILAQHTGLRASLLGRSAHRPVRSEWQQSPSLA